MRGIGWSIETTEYHSSMTQRWYIWTTYESGSETIAGILDSFLFTSSSSFKIKDRNYFDRKFSDKSASAPSSFLNFKILNFENF